MAMQENDSLQNELLQAHILSTVKAAAFVYVVLTLAASVFAVICVYNIVFNLIGDSDLRTLVNAWASGISAALLLAVRSA